MQEWKASEKEAQKMTRDGAISVSYTHLAPRRGSTRPTISIPPWCGNTNWNRR